MAISDRQVLDSLSRMPFIDSADLAGVLGEAHATVHRALTGLLADGIVGWDRWGSAGRGGTTGKGKVRRQCEAAGRAVRHCAEEAGLRPAPTTDAPTDTPTKDLDAKRAGFRRHGLSKVVRGFKSFSGRRVNELRGTPGVAVWQRGYFEHVVRNEEDLNRIRQYIVENPLRWSLRREAPDVGLGKAVLR